MKVNRIAAIFATMWLATSGYFVYANGRTASNTDRIAQNQVALARHAHRQDVSERVALQAQVSACKRLNVQRALINRESYANWNLWRLFIRLVVHPPQVQRSTPSQRVAVREFLHFARAEVASLEWTPLTDCEAAVTKSGFPTLPTHSITRQRPPAAALHPTEGGAR